MNNTRLTPWTRFVGSVTALVLIPIGTMPRAFATDQTWTNGNTTATWSDGLNWSVGTPGSGDNVFLPFAIPSGGGTITLGAGSLANALTIRNNYTLTGGDLTLTTGGVRVDLGVLARVDSILAGTAGLTLTGGGSLRLGGVNTYTGTTTINNGALIVSNGSALGGDTSAIVVNGSATRGAGGGSLVLDGTSAGVTISRDLSLQGYGPIADRSSALVSVGNNTLTGVVTMAQPTAGTNVNTRITSGDGMLTLSAASTLNVQGVAATTLSTFGGTNQAGAPGYTIAGTLTGTGTLEKSGAGTLFLNPSNVSGFSGAIRVTSNSVTGTQGTIRITNPGVIGSRTGTGANSVIDLNAGFLEVRMNTPTLQTTTATNANVYSRSGTNSTFFLDHAPGGEAVNGTLTLGEFGFAASALTTFSSRNGYGFTFGAAPVVTGDNDATITNSVSGLLTFTGAFWSNTNNAAARTITIAGNGNTLISGAVTASSAAFNHNLVKTGSGLLSINNQSATLDGTVSVQGSLAIRDIRAIGSATNVENILLGNTTTTAGNLIFGTASAPTAANLTTTRPIVLQTTTASNAIYASQSGTTGVTLNGAITMPATTTASLILGGTNTADNTVGVAIPTGGGASPTNGLIKQGIGTWRLTAANAYPGATTITAGTLKLAANAAASTIIPEATANTVVFNVDTTTQNAGGTLEFVGVSGSATTEALGALTPTAGGGTVRLTSGGGGAAANLTFTSLGTVGKVAGVNFDTSAGGGGTVTLTGVATTTATTLPGNGHLYFNGTNFAVSTAGILGAPTYTVGGAVFNDAGGANLLVASRHNQLSSVLSAAPASISLTSLRLGADLTMALNGILTVNTGAVANDGGILASANATIATSGTGGVTTGGAGTLVYQVPTGVTLTQNAPILSTTTGGFTKNGAGVLVIGGANAQTGASTINEGTVRLATAGVLSSNSTTSDLAIRQGATLDLNGISTGTAIRSLNGSGSIVNGMSPATPAAATLQVGNNNGTGTFTGVISNGTGGALSVTKVGTGAMSWLGSSTYTGVTTIGSTGLVTVNTLANGGVASGIGQSSAAASNLVFNGSTGGLVYAGGLLNGSLAVGSTSASTDRLFTLAAAATGATLSSTAANGNSIVWSATGAIDNQTTAAATLVFTGTSTGDNTFNPQLVNSSAGGTPALGISKTAAGQWNLGNSNNTYSGPTNIAEGILGLNNNGALSANSPLTFSAGATTTAGVLQMSGSFERNLAATAANGSPTVTWASTSTGGGGFAAHSTDLVVAIGGIGGPTALTWGSGGFVGTTGTQSLLLNSTSALAAVDFRNAINLNGAVRTVNVQDNTSTGADYAILSGVLSGTGTSGLQKAGTGILKLTAANSYAGVTDVNAGTLVVSSLGSSTGGATSSVGAGGVTMDNTNAVTLGNAGTGGAILQYVGPGETSDRKIRFNSTTGAPQIHADGSGPVILTNVINDFASPTGAKTLTLRGSSSAGNMITSNLTNDAGGGTLGVTVDGGATWILSGNNTYTGNTTAGGGALGVGSSSATSTGTFVHTAGLVFAYGADRTFSNASYTTNNTTTVQNPAFIGDYSLTISTPWTHTNTTVSNTITNSIVAGKFLTLGGDITSNAITAARTLTFNGTGDTVINGNVTTSTLFGLNLTYSGTGSLTLAGTASDINNGTVTISSGTLRLGANEVIPHGAVVNTTTTAASAASTTVTVADTTGLVVGQLFTGTGVTAGATVASIIDGTTFTASAAQTIASGAQLLFDQKAGNVVISPAAGASATFDLNGKNETINGLTASAGLATSTTTINNSSATAASLTFGANDQAVTIGGGGGAYNITNTGGGALSLTKTGTGAGTISTGVTLAYNGTTTVNGGSLTVSSAVNGTTGLSVSGTGSLLALNGGITTPSAITSVSVGNGSTLNLLDGAGNQMTALSTLSLGSIAGTNTTLGLNVGDSATAGDNLNTDLLKLATGGTLNLFAGNKITFNLTDTGLNPGTNYVLLDATNISGGLTLGALGLSDYILGATPGGFTSMTLSNSTDNQIILTTGTLITGASYWRGLAGGGTDTTWNANANNWATDKANTGVAASIPGQGTDVVFQINTASNAAVTTTLEQNFKINSLTFEADGTPANTPTAITINPGVVTTSRLEIAPQLSTAGINISGGGPPAVTIGAPLRLGTNQTWNVADSASVLTLSGGLQGEADVTKTGAGKVTLSTAAASTFNTGLTTDVTVSAGTLELTNVGALGTTALVNRANVVVNGGSFYYNNATSGTLQNNLTLGGGTLSAGGNAQTYSGNVSLTAATTSTINMRDLNSAVTTTTQRNITLSGLLSGTGGFALDSIDTLTAGNAETGTLTINNGSSTWNGPLSFTRGTVVFTNVAGSGTATPYVGFNGDINFSQLGRVIYRNVDGASLTRTAAVNFAAGSLGEFSVDNVGALASNYTVTQSGAVTLGSGGTGATARFSLADAASNLILSGGVVLNGNSSISVEGGDADSLVSINTTGISGTGNLAINDEAGAWATTSTRLAINAASTYVGNTSLNEGTLILGHKDALSSGSLTITGSSTLQAGVDLSSGGSGPVPNALNIAGATVTFTGTNPLTLSGAGNLTGSATFAANGTAAALTLSGNYSITGTNLSTTFDGTGDGFLTSTFVASTGTGDFVKNGTGNWTVSGAVTSTDDFLINAGTTTFTGAQKTVADDIIASGAGTVVNLNATGLFTSAGTTSGLYARAGAVINLNANEAYSTANGLDFIIVGDNATGGGTLNTNTFTITTPRIDIGQATAGFTGSFIGNGAVTVGTAINLYQGSVSTPLAGAGAVVKSFAGTVTLSGDNSGLTGTTAALVSAGELILDYTTSNTTKLRAATGLSMAGGQLTLNGNTSAATTQTVASLTLASGGMSRIDVKAGASQTAVLNLGAITRATVGAGVIRFELPAGVQSAANGITTSSPLVNGILGGWATVNDGTGVYFASKTANNITALASTVKSDATTWLRGENIADTGAVFSGTVADCMSINSLRFDNATGAFVNVTAGEVLDIASGGILVTPNVASGTPGISGGRLSTGTGELIVIQDSTALPFEISSSITGVNGITKAGNGTLRLSGANSSTGAVNIQSGTLIATGGSAVGDSSSVVISNARASTLQILANETIGNLTGGNATAGFLLGNVDVGTNTLTISQATGGTYAGIFTGSGAIVRNGTSGGGNWLLTGSSGASYTGSLTINGGLTYLEGLGTMNASSITVNKGGSFLLSNSGVTRSGTRLPDNMPLTLNSADGAWNGETRPSGLAIRTDQNATTSETIGVLSLASGASYFRGDASGTTGIAGILASNFTRSNNATLDARGRALGGAAGDRNQLRIVDATNQTNFINSLVGGLGAAGTKNISIVPWAFGETTAATLADANMGNSLVTYVSGTGIRPLDLTTEYNTFGGSPIATDNIRESLAADLTGIAGTTINALVVNNSNTAATTVNVTGTGAGQTLALTSGTMLFTATAALTGTPAMGITLGGFDSGITVGGTNEYVMFVQNPTSAVAGGVVTATISSPLSSTADITKSGRGTLVLTGTNTAGGNTNKTTLNEGAVEIADLDNIGGNTGGLVFAGGTLRLGSAYGGDDLSTRTITYLQAGGTIDTNGQNLVLAGTPGSGIGSFTKAGSGTLTLNVAGTYTGGTFISGGTLAIGSNNAIAPGELNVSGGTLDLGSNSISQTLVTTSGANPQITGTGIITATTGFFLNHTTDSTIAGAVLAGSVGLVKAQANTVTLTGANTYTGNTEVFAGTLGFDTIANVGAASSALGAPATAAAGEIRLGLGTTAGGLAYTGSGHTSNRSIALNGSTGGGIINANGTGALILTGGASGIQGGAKTLTLSGTAASSINNQIGLIEDCVATVALLKNGAATWELTASNTYTGATSVDEGILRPLVNQTMIGALNFGSANTITTAGTLDLTSVSASAPSLTVQTDSITNTSNLTIGAAQTLTINGNVTIGNSRAAVTTTQFVASGGGVLVVNNAASNGAFAVGGVTAAVAVGSKTTADFSGLGSMTINLDPATGVVRVNPTNGNNANDRFSVLTLAPITTITANNLAVGDSAQNNGTAGQVNQLILGSTTNILNVNTINVGTGGRDVGSVTFAGVSGTVTVRAADGTSRAALNVGTGAANTGVAAGTGNLVDFNGHNADLLLSTLTIGGQNRNTDRTDTLNFNLGTLDATTVLVGNVNGTANTAAVSTTATSTLNLGGGTTTIGTGGLDIGRSTVAVTGTDTLNAIVNISGSAVVTVADSGTLGSAIRMVNNSIATGITANAQLNINGGQLAVSGNIVKGASTGAGSATLTLAGGTLDMTGNSIGTGGATINVSAQSGTLKNLAELNGGGLLTKSTTGALSMGDGNTYTGGTLVSDGTLLATNSTGSATGSGAVTVAVAGTLGGTGSIIANSGNNITINGTLDAGLPSASTGSALALTVGGSGSLALNGTTLFQLFSGGGTGTLNGNTAADRVVVNAPDWTNVIFGASSTLTITTGLTATSFVAGDSWKIFDWVGVAAGTVPVQGTNGFSSITAPTLDVNLGWDYSNLFTTGAVSVIVVPEPSRALFLMLGLLGLMLRRRRK